MGDNDVNFQPFCSTPLGSGEGFWSLWPWVLPMVIERFDPFRVVFLNVPGGMMDIIAKG